MTSAVDTSGQAASPRVPTLNRPNMVSIGTVVWLSQELMFFAAIFAMYYVSRANAIRADAWEVQTEKLNVPYAVVVTTILVLSSVTAQMGVFAAERGDVFGLRRWYALSALMGTVFLIGQGYEYFKLVAHEGVTIQSSVFGSVFFFSTGFHGLHVLAGVLAFIVLLIRTKMSKFTPANATAAIVVSYYWHFVDIVWIGLFATIYFVK